jgi:hypothetical protein
MIIISAGFQAEFIKKVQKCIIVKKKVLKMYLIDIFLCKNKCTEWSRLCTTLI